MVTLIQQESEVGWQEDYENRVNPDLMTRLLHNAVPVLKAVGWRVTTVSEGGCRSELPLATSSTNQHGTHQAALVSLSADYTGGLALATLLRGIPLSGIHRCKDETSASLWLASMDVKYRNPSTGHLQASCDIPADVAKMVRQRYFAGKRVLVTLPVIFTSNDELVAEAEMKYFAQPSIQLKPTKENPKISPLFKQKLKASARMIAGVRASSEAHLTRFDQSHERQAAGPHGELLADRLNGVLPQLRDMVLARTSHIDRTVKSVSGLQQVVILGVGLDMRPFRLSQSLGGPTFFELDLPEMLEERMRVISKMARGHDVNRRMIAADFKTDDVSELLLSHPDFDPHAATVVVYEGCSMYFTADENEEILTRAGRVMQNPSSRLWSDMVAEGVVNGSHQIPEITKFLDGMEEMGERFIFGCDRPADFLLRCGFNNTETTSAGAHLKSNDPVLGTYQFSVASK
ncbi:SAM-dependent methyltransferase [Rubripirellula reticaptiva]|uniref:Putative S-adenosyl-L-methionine-dependent methyltransferase n=1 Tax=Rubripirellula reticaptiva TaxID=2528013 RepID=A0A5C6EN58_9BACT|nr:SAM-dependent methyltransferase [Rubripirellula reticaptiva]TWU49850.1 putative S-adenosyl-L-methionine-dependent methyltransferase [Rubripirellula reticaptiva]